MDFDDFEFDMDLPEVKIHKLPEGLKDEYKIFVSFDANKKAIIKYEWSPMIGHFIVSFETGYDMFSTYNVFSVEEIRTIFNYVAAGVEELKEISGIKKFSCMPTCPKRARVYAKFLKKSGFTIEESALYIIFSC